MLGRMIDSLRGSGDAPWGRGKWPRIVPLVGAVVLIPMLASAVANFLDIFNPELVVLGGGVTRAGDQLLVPVRDGALARAGGKTDVHSLEPEDLCALTTEAAAMAKVPLACTNYIPCVSEERALERIERLLERTLENPVDELPVAPEVAR